VEFFSLSKAFSMTGWRVGCMVGNASAVAALRTVKENIDNGTLRGVQFAAAKALFMAEKIIPPINEIYRRRRDLVVETLNAAGWSIRPPKATIYVWAPVPEKYAGSSARFAADLLEQTGVVVAPGIGFGQWGEGYFRISLTYPDAVLAEAMSRISRFKAVRRSESCGPWPAWRWAPSRIFWRRPPWAVRPGREATSTAP